MEVVEVVGQLILIRQVLYISPFFISRRFAGPPLRNVAPLLSRQSSCMHQKQSRLELVLKVALWQLTL